MRIFFTWPALVVEEYRKYLDELALLGCQMRAIAPGTAPEPAESKKLDAVLITKNYELYPVKSFFSSHFRYFFYSNPIKIYRMMNEFKPDILHIYYEPFTFMAFEMMLIGKLIRPKLKIIMQSFENLRYKQKYLFSMIEKANIKHMDSLVSVPLEGVDVWRWKGYTKKIYTCPIGYDSDLFYYKNRTSNKFVKICFVGRIVAEKGLFDLMEAFHSLQNKYDLELHIVGNGDLRNKLIAKYQGKNIYYHGTLNNSELPNLFSSMDILVLPSHTTDKWKEQFGRVLTESMACGVVPVGSSSGEIPTVIGDAGLIFKEKDRIDLQNKIEMLLNDKMLMGDLSKKAVERATKYYTWKKAALKTKEIYEEI